MFEKQNSHGQSLLSPLGDPQEDPATQLPMYTEDLGHSHAGSRVVGSVSVSSYEPRLVEQLILLDFRLLPYEKIHVICSRTTSWGVVTGLKNETTAIILLS